MIRIASPHWRAAVLAPGSACPARAQTLYRCVPDGQAVAPDQRASFEIGITTNGEFGSIIFRAANGAAYDRGEQFDEQSRQDGKWSAPLDRDVAHQSQCHNGRFLDPHGRPTGLF